MRRLRVVDRAHAARPRDFGEAKWLCIYIYIYIYIATQRDSGTVGIKGVGQLLRLWTVWQAL